MIFKQSAIILKAIDYSNTSKIFTLFTPEYGKVGLIAKGLKRKKNPYQGGMQILNCINIIYYKKKNSNLGIFKECEIKNYFSPLRCDLSKLFIALYWLELMNEVIVEEESSFDLFQLLYYALYKLSNDTLNFNLIFYVQWHTIRLIGVAPIIDYCINCKINPNHFKRNIFFSFEKGGWLCPSCKQKNPLTNCISVKKNTLNNIKLMTTNKNLSLEQNILTKQEYLELNFFFSFYLRNILNKNLRLNRYIKNIFYSL